MGILDGLKKVLSGSTLDMDSLEGINAIPVPTKKPTFHSDDVKQDLSYKLQRKAKEHKKNGRMDLAIACLKKSNQIMPFSAFMYTRSDYMRLVEYLKKDRQFEEARKAETEIDNMFDGREINNNDRQKIVLTPFLLAKQMGTDLVEATEHHPTCGECAKYQGRVFSISGKSKKYPKLPDIWYEFGGFHHGCRHELFPFFEGVSTPTYHRNIAEYSNKPFVDNRTKTEKKQWEDEEKAAEQIERDKIDYDWIWENLPEIAPKSLSGYKRMKNINSENYQKLVDEAKKKGYQIR